MLTICYRNECVGLLDHATAQKWVAAYQRQLVFDLAPRWNVSATLHYIGDSQIEKPGPTDGILTFVAKSSDPGALGAHWVEDSRPVGEIAIQSAIDDGVEPSTVGSHETTEATCDPMACDAVQVGRLFLAKEVADRVENSDPNYKIDGIAVENFSLPSAFYGGPGPWDFRRICQSNIVLPNGYQLQVDAGSGLWTQVTGENARASKKKAGPSSRRALRMQRAGVAPWKLIVTPAEGYK